MTLSRILFGLLVLLTPAMVTAEELIPWMDDLDQAFSKAQQEKKLVLIHFWHEQCAPCRKLESFVFKDGKIPLQLIAIMLRLKSTRERTQHSPKDTKSRAFRRILSIVLTVKFCPKESVHQIAAAICSC